MIKGILDDAIGAGYLIEVEDRNPRRIRSRVGHGGRNAAWILLKESHLHRKLLGRPIVVVIQQSDELTSRFSYPAISRRANSRIGLTDDPNLIAKCRKTLKSIVGAAIINDDDFSISKGLIERAVDRLSEIRRLIESGNNNRYQG